MFLPTNVSKNRSTSEVSKRNSSTSPLGIREIDIVLKRKKLTVNRRRKRKFLRREWLTGMEMNPAKMNWRKTTTRKVITLKLMLEASNNVTKVKKVIITANSGKITLSLNSVLRRNKFDIFISHDPNPKINYLGLRDYYLANENTVIFLTTLFTEYLATSKVDTINLMSKNCWFMSK